MSSSANSVRLPTGVRDLLPRAAARRRAIADGLTQVFESWGYEHIITPVVEVAEVLERGLGRSDREQAVRFVEPYTGQVLALRPDITPQIARIAATRMDRGGLPARLSYEGPVTRLSRRAGGQREVLQAGIEIIDLPSPHGDVETLALAAAALQTTRLREYRLDLGHVAFSRFALRSAPVERRDELAAALMRKDRSATSAVASSMRKPARAIVEALPTLYGRRSAVVSRARALRLPRELQTALDEIRSVVAFAKELMPSAVHDSISFDLGEVRGFDYYTGIRFRGFADGVGHAVLRGGRYDELVGRYGRSAAATGFAIDVEAVAEAQDTLGIATPEPAAGLFILAGSGQRQAAQKIASAVRHAGHRVAVHVTATKNEAHRARAEAASSRWSHILYWSGGWRGVGPGGQDRSIPSSAPPALIRWFMQGE